MTKRGSTPEKRRTRGVTDLGAILSSRRICVVTGPGGVGKTTTAAALGLGMARRGSKVAVVTIDPAKRLAAALGTDSLGNEPARVSSRRLARVGIDAAGSGQLWAMTLDSRQTFDDLITQLSPDEQSRDDVLSNRIYREMSGAVAGSQEFTAVAKLYELDRDGGFDLVILDTPPSRNAIDFLDAPARISNFFDGRALQILMRPAGFGLRLAGGGTGLLMGVLKRVTGFDLFGDLASFFSAVGGMVDGFSERAHAVAELLADQQTAYLIVSSPEAAPVSEALHLGRELAKRQMTAGVVIANRVNIDPGAAPRSARTKPAVKALGEELSAKLSAAIKSAREAADHDASGLETLTAGLPNAELVIVPLLSGEVHDLKGLARIETELFAGSD